MSKSHLHQTVLLNEAVHHLAIQPNGIYLDATFGRGGHSRAILEALGPEGKLYAIDKDPVAIEQGQLLADHDPRFHLVQGSFGDLAAIAARLGCDGKINGILFDLGVSSPQIDNAERGFSFQADGPLDMRMDTTQGMTAAEWIATASEKEISDVLFRFGEEKLSRKIARRICQERAIEPITRTKALATLIANCYPKKPQPIHPATRSFQAIRIHINQELSDIENALSASIKVLEKKGRLVVISFHSLEDRIVKRFMRDQEKGPQEALGQHFGFMPSDGFQSKMKRLGKMFIPSEQEIAENPRARSAKCRVAEKANA